MTVATREPTLEPARYLAAERESEVKHEYWHGETFAMTGASRRHNLLVGNLVRLLGNALQERSCEVYPSDMRVASASRDVFTYPDVVVACERPVFMDDVQDTLVNPSVVVEVLSPSTEAYDRGKKFEHYRGIGSVRYYALVAQDRPLVELYERRGDGTWSLSVVRAGGVIGGGEVGVELAVDEVYRRVLDEGQ